MERLLRDDADVFVLPSRGGAWGRNLVDSMALGTPVIGCPGSGGPADFLSEDHAWPLASSPRLVEWRPLDALASPALLASSPSVGLNCEAGPSSGAPQPRAQQGTAARAAEERRAASDAEPMWCEPDEVRACCHPQHPLADPVSARTLRPCPPPHPSPPHTPLPPSGTPSRPAPPTLRGSTRRRGALADRGCGATRSICGKVCRGALLRRADQISFALVAGGGERFGEPRHGCAGGGCSA
jgi:hypothetical protein